jgi:Predicted pseudouridylate synthase
MSEYQKIIPIAHKILKNHELCDHCLGRLFSKRLHLSSNKLLGQKLKKISNLLKNVLSVRIYLII